MLFLFDLTSRVVLKRDYQLNIEPWRTMTLIPTTFLQSIFIWKIVNVVWHSIWKESGFLLTYPVTVPYHIYKGVDFPLNYWCHHVSQEKPVKKSVRALFATLFSLNRLTQCCVCMQIDNMCLNSSC